MVFKTCASRSSYIDLIAGIHIGKEFKD